MNLEEICKDLEPSKGTRDGIDSNYPSKDDYEICEYVINNIPAIESVSYRGRRVFKGYAFKKSLEEFKTFSKENYLHLCQLARGVKICRDYEMYNAGVKTSFDIVSNADNKTILNPGYTSSYHLPKIIHDIDIVSLGHEHCHALKETNYYEHKNGLVLGEVIPIFYELVDYENNFLKEKHLQYRLYWLNKQKNIYLLFSNTIKDYPLGNEASYKDSHIGEQKSIYEFGKCYFGCYLSCFYYALILYSMYKEDSINILNLVSDVLNHTMTTHEMLNKLNIYCDIKGEVFENEIKSIKRVLML